MIQPVASHVEISPEVIAFAAEQGVSEILPAVVEMTQRVFPGITIRVYLEDDPEIPDDWHIVIGVREVCLRPEKALDTIYEWNREMLVSCPGALVCIFRLGVELAS